jgi:hypothetical protein
LTIQAARYEALVLKVKWWQRYIRYAPFAALLFKHYYYLLKKVTGLLPDTVAMLISAEEHAVPSPAVTLPRLYWEAPEQNFCFLFSYKQGLIDRGGKTRVLIAEAFFIVVLGKPCGCIAGK